MRVPGTLGMCFPTAPSFPVLLVDRPGDRIPRGTARCTFVGLPTVVLLFVIHRLAADRVVLINLIPALARDPHAASDRSSAS
jgi:hypothetical protein